jgi:hypothetical protein
MRTANDLFEETNRADDVRSSLVLYLLLAGGAGLLGFLTWLLTL